MIFSSNFLPCLQYLVAILKENQININITEQYRKQSYRTRAYIIGSNKVEILNIPVQKASNNTLIKDIKIENKDNWQKQNWKSIQTSYKKSPFFEYYDYLFLPLFEKKYNFLIEYNTEVLSKCLKVLRVNKTICLNEYSYFEIANETISFNAKNRTEIHDFFTPIAYSQVFGNKFEQNLSILDLIFSKGPESLEILKESLKNEH
jgi:hypothetical protein